MGARSGRDQFSPATRKQIQLGIPGRDCAAGSVRFRS